MTAELRKVLIRGATGVGSIRLASLFLGFLTSTILARQLGPEQFGLYALVNSIVAIVALPLYAGLPSLLVRETARIGVTGEWDLQ